MRHVLISGICLLLLPSSDCLGADSSTHEPGNDSKEVSSSETSEAEERFAVMTVKAKQSLVQNGLVLDLPELGAYLEGVGDKLLSEEEKEKFDFGIMIIKHPGTNAFAFGDGTIGIHTGLLIQIENEAQLATVLAHEIIHFIRNHPYEGYHNTKDNVAFWATLSIGTGGIAALPALLALPAGVSGYSRSKERQADLEGWGRLVDAGYDGREAHKVFTLLKENLEEEGESEPFFFASHPKLDQRVENFRDLLNESKVDWSQRRTGREEYLGQIAFLVQETIILNLDSGYSARARRLIDHEASLRGESAMTAYLRAEAARRHPDSETSELYELFKSATSYQDAEAEAWRGHGLAAMKLGYYGEAVSAFNQYLDQKPEAKDRDHIEYYLKQCTEKQP